MPNTNRTGYICAISAVLIWSGFILVSRQGGVSELTPYDVIAIRYLTCAAIVLPIWFIWKRFNLLQTHLVVTALVGGLAYALFAFIGFEKAPASHAAVLLPGVLPLVITFLAVFLNQQRFGLNKWLGISIISLGILLLFGHEVSQSGQLSLGHLCLIGAAICWGIFSVLLNRWNIKPWEATISLALVTCMVYIPIYLIFLPSNLYASPMEDIALQAFYQGLMATIIQMLLYVRAVQLIGASNMGTMMAIVPILAGFTAIPVFNEELDIVLVAALLLVSSGVWLANRTKPLKLKFLNTQFTNTQEKKYALRKYQSNG